jgi:hypothetical protein
MFEKIGQSAEKLAAAASVSRRGFLGKFVRVAGGTALGVAAFFGTANTAYAVQCTKPCCGCSCFDYYCRRDAVYICHRSC